MNKQKNKDKVWLGVEQLTNHPEYKKTTNDEFYELPVVDQMSEDQSLGYTSSRRDFLKYLGFGLGAATIAAGCEIPVKRAIPYVVKPDKIVPGVASYFASTFVQGGDYCPLLVKTREGRPIKVEGNPMSPLTKGGTSARAQASVLSLYDTSRIPGPFRIVDGKINMPKKGQGPTWQEIDKEIMGKLSPNSTIRIVSNTVLSPTTKKAVADFTAKFPNTSHITYDPTSSSALLQANKESFGEQVIPDYHFDKADVIVAFDADFLGTWVSPIEYATKYAQNRKVDLDKPKMSYHVQVENNMSLTGSNADNRILVKPSEQGAAIVALYNEVAALTGNAKVSGPNLDSEKVLKFKKLAKRLVENRSKSLVIAGSNNVGEQVLVNGINTMLDNYNNTIDFAHASLQRQGIDQDMVQLIKEIKAEQVDAIILMDGANPAWDLPDSGDFREGLKKVSTKISLSSIPNETTLLCDYVTPTHHYLESWSDAEAKRGHYTLIQPTIYPLFRTRQTEESLLTWAQSEKLNKDFDQPVLDYLKAHWEEKIFPTQDKFATFQNFWDSCLHDGVYNMEAEQVAVTFVGDVNAAASKVTKPSNAELEISFFETVNMGAGQYANNPWLQEMPDPITRCTWGNYLAIPVKWDGNRSFEGYKSLNGREIYGEADIVTLEVNGNEMDVTVVRQFGQMNGTLGLALGYGRETSGQMGKALGEKVGVNVYPTMERDSDGNVQYYSTKGVAVSDVKEVEKLFACVQYHHSMGLKGMDEESGKEINLDEKAIMTLGKGYQGGITDRSIIYQGNIKEVEDLKHHIEEKRAEAKKLNDATLYPYETYKEDVYSQGHHWAMHVDLNACIGCGACQVACIAENNVAVVGKTEVARHHEMTWLRIDRYFYGDYENPNVVYQPLMCQHCDNAPCENVCPVAATNHSSEGLNQMTYNRCIGTRYCANNCPFKVRRFNWLDYTTADLFAANEYAVNGEEVPFGADNLTRMVLNPDVTVRSRGVIEKCSFCVQRIQEGKLTAKREERRLQDNDVKTACQTACPTGAIVFGDRNNKKGMLAERMDNDLNYLLLEEINVQSSVYYSAKVNNRDEELDA